MNRTEAQTLASRRNGANSRGPATAAGKARSALNATKHGLWSRELVLSTEDPKAWEQFQRGLIDSLRPTTPAARELVEQLAAATWRLDRIMNIETALMNAEIERLENEHGPKLKGTELTAAAFQSLHHNGILGHVNRQEARLRRIVDKLFQQWSELSENEMPQPQIAQTNPAREIRRNEPANPPAPPPALPVAKRPTYDANGRRIVYPDRLQAA